MDPEFTGEKLHKLVLDLEMAVGRNAAGATPLGSKVTELAEAAWKAYEDGEEVRKSTAAKDTQST